MDVTMRAKMRMQMRVLMDRRRQRGSTPWLAAGALCGAVLAFTGCASDGGLLPAAPGQRVSG